jgi:hypothetical protein
MLRPRLEIPRRLHQEACDNNFLIQSLVASNVFECVEGDLPCIIDSRRWRKNFNLLRVNGTLVGIDTWDGLSPTWLGHEILYDVDLLLKIQHRPGESWSHIEDKYGLHVSPWTMFGYVDFPPGYFQWSAENHRYLCVFSGHAKRPKRRWVRYLEQVMKLPVKGIQAPVDYLELTRHVRWGLILQGRKGVSCDGKNRREHAYELCASLPISNDSRPRLRTARATGGHRRTE